VAAPKTSAPATAGARQGGGARRAGATIQKPEAASPETNEQFALQAPSKRYQGRNASGPPKSTTWTGRGRWVWSLRPRLTMSPEPIAIVAIRKITPRPVGAQKTATPARRRA
jgi:hypothetical protein